MIKAERHDRIMAELARRGAIGVQELAAWHCQTNVARCAQQW